MTKAKPKIRQSSINLKIITCKRCGSLIPYDDKKRSEYKALWNHQRFCSDDKNLKNSNNFEQKDTDDNNINNNMNCEQTDSDADDIDNNINNTMDFESTYDQSNHDLLPNIEENVLNPDIDQTWLEFQKKLHLAYTNGTLNISNFNHTKLKPSEKDSREIFKFIIDKNLSVKDADDLLDMLRKLYINNNISTVKTPNHYRTLKKQITKGIMTNSDGAFPENHLFQFLTWKMKLDKDLFPDNQKAIDYYCYSLREMIGEVLLNVKRPASNFIRYPDERYTLNTKLQIIEESTSASIFKKLSNAVKLHVTDAIKSNELPPTKPPDPVVVMLGFTLDGTTSKSMKRQFTPVNFYILNLINEEFKMNTIGLAPSNRLPYNEKDMLQIISSIGKSKSSIITKKNKKSSTKKSPKSNTSSSMGKLNLTNKVMKHYKLKFQRDYLYYVFKDILETQDKGVYLRVGSFDDPNGYYIHAFIHLVCISGDNLQLDYLAGTHFKSKHRKCRICMSTNIHSLDDSECIGEFRVDKVTAEIEKRNEEVLKHRCQIKKGNRISEKYKTMETNGKVFGLSGGENKLMEHFEFQSLHDINNFSKSLAPDLLHTFIKGLLEDAIAWSVLCIIFVGKTESYSDNMSRLDKNIKNFPCIQSLIVFPNKPMFRFHEGISQMFKSHKRNQGTVATGFFANGSIEAWKLPQLLLQLIFSINKSIVPFTVQWSKLNGMKHPWNIGRTIVNTLTSVFELHLILRMKIMTTDAIDKLMGLIRIARAHLQLLRKLKENLIKGEITSKSIMGGMKHHVVMHLPFYKLNLGVDHRTYDTEIAELHHKVLKELLERTNKQYNQVDKGILVNYRIKQHVQNMSDYNSNLEKISSNDFENSAIGSKYKVGNLIPSMLVVRKDIIFVKRTIVKNNNYKKARLKNHRNELPQTHTYVQESNFLNMRMVNFNQFITICNTSKCEEFDILWSQFKASKNTDCACSLLNKVTILSNLNVQTSNDIIIHCNGRYNIKKSNVDTKIHNVCSFVEVKYVMDNNEIELTEIACVVAIVKFKGDDEIFLVICWMQKSNKNHSVLPYQSYQHCLEKGKLFYDIVSIKNVIRPAWLISHKAENELNWADKELKTIDQLKENMYYILPYNVIVRDQCDDFIEFKGDYTNNARSDHDTEVLNEDSLIYNALPMMLSDKHIDFITQQLKDNSNDSLSDDDWDDVSDESDDIESDESDNDSCDTKLS